MLPQRMTVEVHDIDEFHVWDNTADGARVLIAERMREQYTEETQPPLMILHEMGDYVLFRKHSLYGHYEREGSKDATLQLELIPRYRVNNTAVVYRGDEVFLVHILKRRTNSLAFRTGSTGQTHLDTRRIGLRHASVLFDHHLSKGARVSLYGEMAYQCVEPLDYQVYSTAGRME